ncbi:glycoside hydrolase family 28 protein [Cadophora sp. DSE1049]|nr:glycoside hydrolase family 28 protein [Cadophora sp. DSE1049]
MAFKNLLIAALVSSFVAAHWNPWHGHYKKTCIVKPACDVMNTTGLENCEVDLRGTMLWSTDIPYWLNHSMPMGYQNQSTAWIFGGVNVTFRGHSHGTLDGNGQVWYDFVNGTSNYPRRPQAITISRTKNSLFEGIRFVQTKISILLQDIYVSSTSNSSASVVNTDRADTIYANIITFNRWSVTNGDDCISPKANSISILVSNSFFNQGVGFALGSISQYNGVFERIENFTAENIICNNTLHAGYMKTWTGQQVGFPPKGRGGGIGFSITQYCNSSQFKIEDFTMANVTGTVKEDPIAIFQCSGAAPCENISLNAINLELANGTAATGWLCDNLRGNRGFNCTGSTCGRSNADGTC